MEKHNLYYRILDSFQSPECPICFYLTNSIEKYFDNLLYEGVSDSGFIQKFRDNRGMCNTHIYKLASYKDGLAVVSLFSYLSSDETNELKSLNFKHLRLKKRKNCQACEFVKSIEDIALSTVYEFLSDNELKEAYINSHGLCYPHYLNLVRLCKRDLPEWLNTFQISKFEDLISKLKTYLDFQNFSLKDNRPELSYDEQLVYQKAVRIFSGYEGMKF